MLIINHDEQIYSIEDGSWLYLLGIPLIGALVVGIPFFISWATWVLLKLYNSKYQDEVMKSVLLGCGLTLLGAPLTQLALGDELFWPSLALLPILGSFIRYLIAFRQIGK
jgi:Na+/glutamate symporter